jgi:hypothetical protein
MREVLNMSETRIKAIKRRCLADQTWKTDMYEVLQGWAEQLAYHYVHVVFASTSNVAMITTHEHVICCCATPYINQPASGCLLFLQA